MSLELQMEQMPGYITARFVGLSEYVAEGVWRQFELVAEHCERTNNDKVLIDTTRAPGRVSLVERFLLGEKTQIFMFHDMKVAFVDMPERIDPRRFGELVARNRGVEIRVFSDFRIAEEWLLKCLAE